MRRESGLISSPAGLGLHDHVCWTCDDDGARDDAVAAWLRGGLALGQRVVDIAGAHPDEQRDALSALGDVEGLAARGALDLIAVGEVYAAGRGADPGEQLRVDAAAAERARAGGFSGLCVAAEITRCRPIGPPGRRSRGGSSRPDRYCATAPFAAIIDLAGVEFSEHNGLLAIDRALRGRGAVEVRDLSEAARRLGGLLSLPL